MHYDDILKGQPYELIVEFLIRLKYTLSQELAIQRQRETKPEEYQEYYAFCEACKVKAKEITEAEQNDN